MQSSKCLPTGINYLFLVVVVVVVETKDDGTIL